MYVASAAGMAFQSHYIRVPLNVGRFVPAAQCHISEDGNLHFLLCAL